MKIISIIGYRLQKFQLSLLKTRLALSKNENFSSLIDALPLLCVLFSLITLFFIISPSIIGLIGCFFVAFLVTWLLNTAFELSADKTEQLEKKCLQLTQWLDRQSIAIHVPTPTVKTMRVNKI